MDEYLSLFVFSIAVAVFLWLLLVRRGKLVIERSWSVTEISPELKENNTDDIIFEDKNSSSAEQEDDNFTGNQVLHADKVDEVPECQLSCSEDCPDGTAERKNYSCSSISTIESRCVSRGNDCSDSIIGACAKGLLKEEGPSDLCKNTTDHYIDMSKTECKAGESVDNIDAKFSETDKFSGLSPSIEYELDESLPEGFNNFVTTHGVSDFIEERTDKDVLNTVDAAEDICSSDINADKSVECDEEDAYTMDKPNMESASITNVMCDEETSMLDLDFVDVDMKSGIVTQVDEIDERKSTATGPAVFEGEAECSDFQYNDTANQYANYDNKNMDSEVTFIGTCENADEQNSEAVLKQCKESEHMTEEDKKDINDTLVGATNDNDTEDPSRFEELFDEAEGEYGDDPLMKKTAIELKDMGNEHFREGRYSMALDLYTKAIQRNEIDLQECEELLESIEAEAEEIHDQQMLDKKVVNGECADKNELDPDAVYEDDEDESNQDDENETDCEDPTIALEKNPLFKVLPEEVKERYRDGTKKLKELDGIRAVLKSNKAACLIHFKRYDDAIANCSDSIQSNPKYSKAYLRRSSAYEGKEKWHEALSDLKKAIELDSTIESRYSSQLRRLERVSAEQFEKEKEEMVGKLKDFGNFLLGKVGLSLDNFNVEKNPDTGSYNISFNQGKPQTNS